MTNTPVRPFVLFRVAAGPRLGHGHLRRAEALARALGRSTCISIRGGGRTPTALDVVPPAAAGTTLDAVNPVVLVLDDPHPGHAHAWAAAATRRRIPVVSVHDLGIARVASNLAIDGSVTSPARGWPARHVRRGLAYAVIAPPRRQRRSGDVRRVLVSLGGGPRRALALAIVAELRQRHPRLEILLTQALDGTSGAERGPVRAIRTTAGLAPWFARVDVAIVGGGVSLYEAIAAGVPSVAVPVVPAQRPTIRGFATLRLAIDGGGDARTVAERARRVADRFDALVADARWRRAVRRRGPRAIDGRGVQRVARAITSLVGEVGRA